MVAKVVKALGAACAGVFCDVPADSGVHVVNAGAELGRAQGADSIVSVGGGSVIDTAKGIAILLREGGSLLDYQGFQLLTRAPDPAHLHSHHGGHGLRGDLLRGGQGPRTTGAS